MKKYFIVLSIAFAGAIFLNFDTSIENPKATIASDEEIAIPEDVNAVIENSCYGCHNSNSKNTKGKSKIKFDELGEYKTHKLVGKLGKVAEAVKTGDMPPKKFLNKYPEKALTDEQKALVADWAESTAKSYTE